MTDPKSAKVAERAEERREEKEALERDVDERHEANLVEAEEAKAEGKPYPGLTPDFVESKRPVSDPQTKAAKAGR